MIKISGLALIAALTSAGSASTVFAQCLETGTAADTFACYGRQVHWTARQTHRSFVRRSGLRAFAAIPANDRGGYYYPAFAPGDPDDPALTGGGSFGYNYWNNRDE